jgi:hypothetical protein
LLIPSVVGGAYKLTIVTPGVRERVVGGRFVPVEAEPCGFSEKMRADECFLTFSVSHALHRFCHSIILAGE